MSHTSEDNPTTIEPLLVAPKFARNSLGIGETTFWELVKRGLIPLASYGRKRLVPYPALKELARRIEAGEIAPARQGFSAPLFVTYPSVFFIDSSCRTIFSSFPFASIIRNEIP